MFIMILKGTYYPIIIPICNFMVRVCHAIVVIKLFVSRRATTTQCNNCGWLLHMYKKSVWVNAEEHWEKQLTTVVEHLKNGLCCK